MGRYSGKSCRLICMMVMTSTFFIAEITTGYVTSSMALVADSFHMLSDIVSLIVGFVAIKVSKLTTSRNTYGWVRAEVVGALVNGVFLVALCFTIFVEALQRFIEKEIRVEKPILVLGVGTAGLAVNLLGLCLFSGHGHSHSGGSHGHSHGSGGYSPSHSSDDKSASVSSNVGYKGLKDDSELESGKSLLRKENGNLNGDVTDHAMVKVEEVEDDIEATIASGSQLNMRGVFLHVLGDALGSLVVIISALIIWLAEGEWRFYVDPAMSLFICVIILATSIPLLKQSAMILMQSIPSHVDVENIKSMLEEQYPEISLHDFHVWQLTSNLTIATAHIIVTGNVDEYMAISLSLKDFFHKRGIHSTTIQPEFVRDRIDSALIENNCVIMCKTDACDSQRCCKPKSEDSVQSQRKASAVFASPEARNGTDSNIEVLEDKIQPTIWQPPIQKAEDAMLCYYITSV